MFPPFPLADSAPMTGLMTVPCGRETCLVMTEGENWPGFSRGSVRFGECPKGSVRFGILECPIGSVRVGRTELGTPEGPAITEGLDTPNIIFGV